MGSLRRRGARPSPAIVVAVMALVAALAGTAIAGPDATTSLSKKKTKKTARQEAKKQINKLVLPVGDEQLDSISTTEQSTTLTANQAQSVTATCPEGQKLLSGGARFNDAPLNLNNYYIQASYKTDNAWTAIARAPQNNRQFTVYAYCLGPGAGA